MVTVVCVRVVTVVRGKEVTVIECAIGGLPKCAKFTCTGDTFQITHLIYVPDSDNLVFLWTMSYSLWTM